MRFLVSLLFSLQTCLCLTAQAGDHNFARDNVAQLVRSFPYAALVSIQSFEPVQTIRDDKGRAGYVTFKVKGRVMERFKGRVSTDLEFFVTQEQPSSPPSAGTFIVVLYKAKDGRFFFADESVWWVKSTPDLISAARAAGASKQAR